MNTTFSLADFEDTDRSVYREIPPVVFERIDENLKYKEPHRSTKGSVGYDIYSAQDVNIVPGDTVLVHTNFRVKIKPGFFCKIETRSSMALKGITVEGGVIDSDYTGEVGVILRNSSKNVYNISVFDRIAQLIILPSIDAIEGWVISNELDDKTRGSRGFGSTGI